MNYKITFSTYVNATGTHTPHKTLLRDLVAIANVNHVQGWSLTDQTGFWAGELEASHALTLLDTTPEIARSVARQIKTQYHQDAVILEPLLNTEVEFI
jgi:hypothetical protein